MDDTYSSFSFELSSFSVASLAFFFLIFILSSPFLHIFGIPTSYQWYKWWTFFFHLVICLFTCHELNLSVILFFKNGFLYWLWWKLVFQSRWTFFKVWLQTRILLASCLYSMMVGWVFLNVFTWVILFLHRLNLEQI